LGTTPRLFHIQTAVRVAAPATTPSDGQLFA